MSLCVVLVNFKVAELFCRNRFGDAAVNMGVGRGFLVDCVTGWDTEDDEHVKEVEGHVMEEEFVLLIVSPMCRSFSKFESQVD